MPGQRIPELPVLTAAASDNSDDLLIYDTDAEVTKRISRSQLGLSVAGDLGGANGMFTTADGKTVTVIGGLITSIA